MGTWTCRSYTQDKTQAERPPIRAVLHLVKVGAVLRKTARLPQAATVISPATTSGPAVVTMAATVRIQRIWNVWYSGTIIMVIANWNCGLISIMVYISTGLF